MAACRHCGKRPRVSSKQLRRLKVKKRELEHGFCAICLGGYRRTKTLSKTRALRKLRRQRNRLYFRRATRARVKKSKNLGVGFWSAYVDVQEIQQYFRIPTYATARLTLAQGRIPLRVFRRRLPDLDGRHVLHVVVSRRSWEALKARLEAGDIPWRMQGSDLIRRVPQLQSVLARLERERAARKRQRKTVVVAEARG